MLKLNALTTLQVLMGSPVIVVQLEVVPCQAKVERKVEVVIIRSLTFARN